MAKVLNLLLVVVLISRSFAAIPSFYKLCPKSSPNLVDCVKESIESLRPYVADNNVIPNLVESLNPVFINELDVKGIVNLKVRNFTLYGIKDYKIEKLKINLDNFKIDTIISFNHLEGTGKYSLNWLLGPLNLYGSGDCNLAMEKVRSRIKMYGSRYIRNGAEYLKIDKVEVRFQSQVTRVLFDNLFNGQKQLEKVANDAINQNIEIIKEDLVPVIEKVLSSKLLSITNQIFTAAPYNDIFP